MPFLLDTHTLLWAILDDNKLSGTAKKLITNPANICYFSIVSLWEISIKHTLGSLDLTMSLSDCFKIITDTGFTELALAKSDLIVLNSLAYHHKDPFDRVLIAQALHNNLSIITKDGMIAKYDVTTVW